MNKSVRRMLCLLLSALTVGSLAVSCGGGGGGNPGNSSSSNGGASESLGGSSDNSEESEDSSENSSENSSEDVFDPNGLTETRPVIFSTEPLDGNFNPFFATSATDTEIISLTQIGMLGVTTNDEGEPIVACGQDQPTVVDSYTITEAKDKSYTDYSFVIKNGIKFSNGSDLTIEDVLFNLYVYLDPGYMGSATIYSTDIVGLAAYQAQDPALAESDSGLSSDELNKQFYDAADARIDNILEYLDSDSDYEPTEEEKKNIDTDIARLKELFKEEINRDWNSNAGTQTSYEQEYTLKENWEIFFFVEGLAGLVMKSTENGSAPLKDAYGKYITTLTKPGAPLVINDKGTPDDTSDDEVLEAYDGSYQGQTHYASHLVEEIESAAADEAKIFAMMNEDDRHKGCTREEAIEFVIQDTAIAMVCDAYTTDTYLEQILLWWASGDNLREELMAQARTAYYEKELASGMKVNTISGITTAKTADGKNDVLKIRINGVDPKAIWNFGFTVAPKYYYSNADAIENTSFGVKWNDFDFFNKVLQAPEKTALPVGAGVYMATDINGADNVGGGSFYRNNFVYYKRNPYFETVGSGLCNAKIKYLRYKVVNSDQIVMAMKAGEIDIGEPNATATNISEIQNAGLKYKTSATNGYGYVGINPKYVPDIEVRRAIMYAMNTEYTMSYYTEQLADLVFRSMSKQSWAYPKNAEPYYNPGDADTMIPQLLDDAGWVVGGDGKRYKKGKKLELTFTIAGGTTDHPAYDMFIAAEEILESYGFVITVKNDPSALKKLATGNLEVWAAAWSSTVDPDMYQVYHKDSNATSTKNWGYDTIFADQTGEQFFDEQKMIEDLSELIDDARETTAQSKRADIYAEALDLVMELAVELPTYQRNDCVAYTTVIDANSLNQNPNAFAGVIDKLWELNYVR